MLYKYVGNDNDSVVIERLAAFVDKGTIYASRPLDFNDPAELKVTLDFEADFEVIKQRFHKDQPHQTEEEFRNWYASLNEHSNWWIAYKTREKNLTSDGIVCLTREYDNFLMWSHYAHSHTGICIGFEDGFAETIQDRGLDGDVVYVDSYPRYNFFTEPQDKYLRAAYLHKGLPWAYEKEYRVVTTSFGVKTFNKSFIKEVILGCRASPKLQDYACTLIDKGIEVYKMALSENTYQLRKILVKKNHYFQGDA